MSVKFSGLVRSLILLGAIAIALGALCSGVKGGGVVFGAAAGALIFGVVTGTACLIAWTANPNS